MPTSLRVHLFLSTTSTRAHATAVTAPQPADATHPPSTRDIVPDQPQSASGRPLPSVARSRPPPRPRQPWVPPPKRSRLTPSIAEALPPTEPQPSSPPTSAPLPMNPPSVSTVPVSPPQAPPLQSLPSPSPPQSHQVAATPAFPELPLASSSSHQLLQTHAFPLHLLSPNRPQTPPLLPPQFSQHPFPVHSNLSFHLMQPPPSTAFLPVPSAALDSAAEDAPEACQHSLPISGVASPDVPPTHDHGRSNTPPLFDPYVVPATSHLHPLNPTSARPPLLNPSFSHQPSSSSSNSRSDYVHRGHISAAPTRWIQPDDDQLDYSLRPRHWQPVPDDTSSTHFSPPSSGASSPTPSLVPRISAAPPPRRSSQA